MFKFRFGKKEETLVKRLLKTAPSLKTKIRESITAAKMALRRKTTQEKIVEKIVSPFIDFCKRVFGKDPKHMGYITLRLSILAYNYLLGVILFPVKVGVGSVSESLSYAVAAILSFINNVILNYLDIDLKLYQLLKASKTKIFVVFLAFVTIVIGITSNNPDIFVGTVAVATFGVLAYILSLIYFKIKIKILSWLKSKPDVYALAVLTYAFIKSLFNPLTSMLGVVTDVVKGALRRKKSITGSFIEEIVSKISSILEKADLIEAVKSLIGILNSAPDPDKVMKKIEGEGGQTA